MTTRVIVGLVVAALIAAIARKRAQLSTGGSLVAVVVGTLAVTAGTRWGALLVAYFVLATALSAWRHAEKHLRTASIVEKRGPRDAWQVVANGSVFVVCALIAGATQAELASAAALGALAASMADTAATEVGSAIASAPRSIISGQKVPAGLSGGVTWAGTLAMFGGSAVLGTFALALGFSSRAAWAALAGGIAGALADSLLGAVIQERRQCPACGMLTERRVHGCGAVAVPTDVVGGVEGFDNDWVNLTSTALGALVAGVLSRGGV
ncbi:MAG: DUF92 domain-containing protein [Gemmatimonadaceae bacterium]